LKIQQRQPTGFLQGFVGGSLALLLICLSGIALTLTLSYVAKEQKRAHVAEQQFEQFFSFHYQGIAEEMWTGNLQAIAMRIGLIANQMGNAQYELFVSGEDGKCVYAVRSGAQPSTTCQTPQALVSFPAQPKLSRHPTDGSWTYAAPLALGGITKGYLFAHIQDAYGFYQGGVGGLYFRTVLPVLAAVLAIWGIWLLVARNLFLKPYLRQALQHERARATGELAARVAHDIRSPLAALSVMNDTFRTLPADQGLLIQRALHRIQDIANDLLKTYKTGESSFPLPPAAEKAKTLPAEKATLALLLLAEDILAEKRQEYCNRRQVKFVLVAGEQAHRAYVVGQRNDLMRAISNLINNSVASISQGGTVTIECRCDGQRAELVVADNGRGIPKPTLDSLKQNSTGLGLGLRQVRETLEVCEGTIDIASVIGVGTQVRLGFPLAPLAQRIARRIQIPEGNGVVVIDDDDSIHSAWEQRIPVPIHPIFSAADALVGIPSLRGKNIFLVDCNFVGETIKGDALVAQAGIAGHSILVSSQWDSELDGTLPVGTLLLPKRMIPYVPIHLLSESPFTSEATL
jgi:signal transduction histidine kinase